MSEQNAPLRDLPAPDATREEWVGWLAQHLGARWPLAQLRVALAGMAQPGIRRGVQPDIEFWYPNDGGIYQMLHLYRVLPTDLLGTRDALEDLAALLAYCKSNGRQLTLIVPDRPLQQEELEALDSVLLATLSPMLFEVAAYQIA